MIYYTADLHLHYAPLLAGRPFATVAEMDEALIRNWNNVVTEADTVYLAATTTRGLRTPCGCTSALKR